MAYTTIDDPSAYFQVKTYAGTDASPQAFTLDGNSDLQPDWVWIKNRGYANKHVLFDSVRGVNKSLTSNSENMELNQNSDGGYLSAFNSNGFTLTEGSSSDNDTNDDRYTYVAWNWLGANGTASNSDGSITTTVSANTTSGFSIIDFTGNESNSSIGHGLGVAPSMFIMKRYTDDGYADTGEWYVYHKDLASDKYLRLQSTAAVATNDGSLWNTSTPVTSSVINIGLNANSNHTGNKTIVYAFAEKKGYSKFGSYIGNGNADGTYVHLGFKPAFVMSKCTSHAGEDWNINDDKRPGYNVIQNALLPNSSAAEVTASFQAIDTLSNGFKWRGTNDRVNASGKTYIYMAFAENPFVTSTGIPTTAR